MIINPFLFHLISTFSSSSSVHCAFLLQRIPPRGNVLDHLIISKSPQQSTIRRSYTREPQEFPIIFVTNIQSVLDLIPSLSISLPVYLLSDRQMASSIPRPLDSMKIEKLFPSTSTLSHFLSVLGIGRDSSFTTPTFHPPPPLSFPIPSVLPFRNKLNPN